MQTETAFVFANGDPGLDLLNLEARHVVRSLKRRGQVTLDIIDGADHTFSPPVPREEALSLIELRFMEFWGTGAADSPGAGG